MELGVDFSVALITETDKTKKFSTGNPAFQPLKTFLIKQALDFQNSLVAQTYVAKTPEDKVIAFVTLTSVFFKGVVA